jgi:hypothetical protein
MKPVFAFGWAWAALASLAPAQRIWTLSGLPGVIEESAATGALLSAFALPPPLVPFAAPLGDLAVDRATGTLWLTDGFTIAQATRTGGAILRAEPVPPPFGPLTGLAFDVSVGLPNLWITDGFLVGNFGIAPAGLFPLAPPFPAPFPALVGLDFDSATGTLWVLDGLGAIANVDPFGLVLGFVAPPAVVLAPYTAIAVDTTLPGGPLVPRVWVRGADDIENLLTGAVVEGYEFVGATSEGIGFAPMPNRYGAGTPGPSGFVPDIDWVGGFATIGNDVCGITISNAVPGPSLLVFSGAAADPPVFVPPVGDLWVDPLAILMTAALLAVGPGPGFAGQIFSIDIPPDPTLVGASFFTQWLNVDGVGFALSRGLSIPLGTL